MRFALAVFGSRGDAQPLVALGLALRDAGHQALVCAPSDFQEFVEQRGLPFRALLHDFGQRLAATGTNPLALLSHMRVAVQEQFAELPAAVAGADALVAAGAIVAGRTVAETLRIPFRYVAFCPRMLRSRFHASPAVSWNEAPRALNAATWRVNDWMWNLVARRLVNGYRARAGLEPVRSTFDSSVTADPVLAADPWLAPPPADVSAGVEQTGTWRLRDETPLPADVEGFLAAGEPPALVGFGSMPDEEAGRTLRLVLDAIESTGVRALVSRGIAGIGEQTLPATVLAVGPLNHERLLPRLAAFVHHGGAGTTHAAAFAGVPQVVVPHTLDQHYWGWRVHRLGLGPRPIPRSRLAAGRLAAALRTCLAEEALRRRAKEARARLVPDGVERAARVLVEWAQRSGR